MWRATSESRAIYPLIVYGSAGVLNLLAARYISNGRSVPPLEASPACQSGKWAELVALVPGIALGLFAWFWHGERALTPHADNLMAQAAAVSTQPPPPHQIVDGGERGRMPMHEASCPSAPHSAATPDGATGATVVRASSRKLPQAAGQRACSSSMAAVAWAERRKARLERARHRRVEQLRGDVVAGEIETVGRVARRGLEHAHHLRFPHPPDRAANPDHNAGHAGASGTICCVCYDRCIDTTLHPCGHVALCAPTSPMPSIHPAAHAVVPRSSTSIPYEYRAHTIGASYGLQPGASYGLQPGAPYGLQPGASYGLQPGASYGLQPGASYGLQPGASYGLQQHLSGARLIGHNGSSRSGLQQHLSGARLISHNGSSRSGAFSMAQMEEALELYLEETRSSKTQLRSEARGLGLNLVTGKTYGSAQRLSAALRNGGAPRANLKQAKKYPLVKACLVLI